MTSLLILKPNKPAGLLALLIVQSAWPGPPGLSYELENPNDFAAERAVVAAWEEHLKAEGKPRYRVLDAAVDTGTADWWLGTMGSGLVRYSGGMFTAWDQMNSGLAGNIVMDVEWEDGLIWSATNAGLNSYDPLADRWSLYQGRSAGLPQRIFTTLNVCEGKMQALAAGGGAFEFDSSWKAFEPRKDSTPCILPPSFATTCIPVLDQRRSAIESEVNRPAIALYGPRNRTISIPGAPASTSGEAGRPELAAVEQAISAASQGSAHRGGTPIDLVMIQPGYANYAWGLPEDDLVTFEQRSDVLGIIGYIAEGEHITEAVLARMDLPWMNVAPPGVASTTSGLAGSLVFQCRGDEPRQHRGVFDYAIQRSSAKRAAFIAGSEPADYLHIRWWLDYAHQREVHPVVDYRLDGDQRESRKTLESLSVGNFEVVFLWADCETSGSVIDAVRRSSDSTLIVAGPQVTEGCSAQTPLHNVIAFFPSDEIGAQFVSAKGAARGNVLLKGTKQSENAARSFHATEHLLAAVTASAKSRSAVRRKLAELSGSVFGEEHFEKNHRPGPVTISEFRDGAWRRSTFRPSK